MHRPRSLRVVATVLGLLGLVGACGDDDGKTPPTKTAKAEPPIPTVVEPSEGSGTDDGPPLEDPIGAEGWQDEDTEGTPPAPPPVEEGPFPGPCKITWKDGPTVRMKYTDTGGTVRIDDDGDGKADTCGKFERKDGHTTKVWVDRGCDKKTDVQIVPEPAGEGGGNVVGAEVTTYVDGKPSKRAITLLSIPGLPGLEPGYPLEVAKKDAKLKIEDGLVRRVDVPASEAGPVARVDVVYDKDKRVKTLKEDVGVDGKVERKFDYRYDAKGNVSKISAVLVGQVVGDDGSGKSVTRKPTARLDYSCWKK
jgi:hypothetical protein